MGALRQTNFLGGEVAPALYGRTDLALYSKSLRTCLNAFISQHGEVVSRPGTTFIAATKYAGLGVRLVPFVVSDTESYCCEFGEGYIRFFTNGAVVGGPLEVATPYHEWEVADLKWAQVGDVLTVTHPKYTPYELKRTSTAPTFTFTAVSFALLPTSWVDANQVPVDQPMLVNNPAGSLFYIDAAHPPREWQWKMTALMQEVATGLIVETAPYTLTRFYDGSTLASIFNMPAGNAVVLYPDRGVTIRRGPLLSPGTNPYAATHKILGYQVYRGRGSLFGFVGQTTSTDFFDDGREPDYLVQPPTGDNPLYNSLGTGSYENPTSVTYFQSRRVFGGTNKRPGWLLTSATDDYGNFDKHVLPVPGEALAFELASMRREAIRSVVGLRRLVVLTSASAWSVGGSGGEALDFDNVEAIVVDAVGATGVQPLVVQGDVLYVRTKGRGARALVPSQREGGLEGIDITQHAQHLFLGGEQVSTYTQGNPLTQGKTRQIVDWCYAEDPWGVVWALRQDGVLLSLTYLGGGQAAWARHSTDGFVRALCSVPEGTEDAVYMVVQRDGLARDGTFQVERLNTRVRNDGPYQDAAVDACKRIDVVVADNSGGSFLSPYAQNSLTLTGLSHLEGKSVYAVSVGNPPFGPYVVTGGSITLPRLPTANDADVNNNLYAVTYVGLAYMVDVEPLDVTGADGKTKQKTVVKVGFEVDQSKGLKVGQDFDHLTEWRQRTVADSYGSPSAAHDVVQMFVTGKWDLFARAALRQTLPLPFTLLGLTREVDGGG